eukprot:1326447-Amorphochlora_amoeboformis.AAC.1
MAPNPVAMRKRLDGQVCFLSAIFSLSSLALMTINPTSSQHPSLISSSRSGVVVWEAAQSPTPGNPGVSSKQGKTYRTKRQRAESQWRRNHSNSSVASAGRGSSEPGRPPLPRLTITHYHGRHGNGSWSFDYYEAIAGFFKAITKLPGGHLEPKESQREQ